MHISIFLCSFVIFVILREFCKTSMIGYTECWEAGKHRPSPLFFTASATINYSLQFIAAPPSHLASLPRQAAVYVIDVSSAINVFKPPRHTGDLIRRSSRTPDRQAIPPFLSWLSCSLSIFATHTSPYVANQKFPPTKSTKHNRICLVNDVTQTTKARYNPSTSPWLEQEVMSRASNQYSYLTLG